MEHHRLYDQNIDYIDTYRTDPSSFAIVSRYRIVPIEGEQPPKIEGHIGTTHSPVTYKVRFVDW
jgi:hypothetical protein